MTTHPIPADELQARSERLGLATRWHDFYGQEREVSPEALRAALAAMGEGDVATDKAANATNAANSANAWPPVCVLPEGDVIRVPLAEGMAQGMAHDRTPPVLLLEDGSRREGRWAHDGALFDAVPPGYHQVLDGCALIVCPHRAWLPEPLTSGGRWWGAAVQVYALRSESNWGIGDFSDLARLVDVLAAQGAAFVGLNPLHALFAHRPQDASPYSPSSRNAINPLYLDIEAMPDFHESREARSLADREEFRRTLAALRDADEVDYPGVAAVKRPMFEQLWKSFRARHLAAGSARAQQWRRFMAAHPHLQQHALFEALQAHLFAADAQVWGWPAWPPAYRDPAGPAVALFAQEHAERVGFYGWLQWQADQQLEAVQTRARAAGMPLGLYRDLAVGANEGGSEVWARQDAYALGVQVGAPPDPLNALGQNWGLPPFNPQRLTAGRYEAFVELVRANMRHAGALRLDHVMGLMRLFWTGPHGGTYMQYPLADLLGILALESTRHRCMVIGEDLGNVAPRMREAMREHAVLSYCPLYFERTDSGDFRPPAEWRPQALAVVSTHDLPTLRGWWLGEDIELSARLGLYPPEGETGSHGRQVVERATGRALLMLALEREGLLPEGASVHPTSLADATPAFTQAVYAFLARTPCLLLGVQLEDVTQQLLQVNIPGTQETQYPNWRRKLPVTVEDLAADRRLAGVSAALAARRVLRGEGDDTAAGVDAGAAPDVPALSTARIPLATYRLQFHAGFTFADATRVVPYLAALGISHLYASPWQAARAGSTHGYDVVDHNALNPELGDEDAFAAMCQAVARHGMHQMLDIVPNHMGVLEADNAWWLDVLEHGPASLQAETFDIDWNPAAPEMAGRVLLPVLGDHYGRVLERGELTLVFDAAAGSFHVGYYKHRFPVDPADYAAILSAVPVPSVAQHAAVASLLHALAQLPARSDTSADARATRARDARLHKRALAAHVAGDAQLAAWVAACVLAHSGTPGDARSFDALDALLARQAWRLAYWRVAGDDINYRRFFDINTLAALRMERPQVFEATHRKLLRWLQDGSVAALRIDHPDGLADPRAYFERLQSRQAQAAERAGLPRRALYLVVEKILAENEDLPADWPVHGGTGYRFSNLANGLFVDTRNEAALTRIYSDFTGAPADFDDVLYEAKHLIMDVALASDLQWLTESLYRISRRSRLTCDFTRNGLRAALAEVAAAFTVYRTYLTAGGEASTADLRYLEQALRRARRRGVAADLSALDHLRDVLLHGDDKAFIARWQQFTAPVMAKSMEDTAFYRYHRLVSLNDVGGDPRSFGVLPAAFHAVCAAQAAKRPHWLLGTSTHDSKRSEDLRARLDVLSEMPDAWQDAVTAWHAMNAMTAPEAAQPRFTRNDEYLLYQTLVGVWPVTPEGVLPTQEALAALQQRVQDYMRKALREAKRETSWLNPDEAYENAAAGFIAALFGRRVFLQALQQFVNHIAPFGFANSLNLVALKLTAPGVPDIYQGCEQWSFNLVDPDNRRPVDFAALQAQLQAAQALYAGGTWPTAAQWQALRAMPGGAGPGVADGRIKQLLTWRLLALRQQAPDVFCHGGHVPLVADGAAAGHVLAYERVLPAPAEGERTGGALQQVIVVASRLPYGRAGPAHEDGWHDCRLPLPERGRDSGWSDWVSGRAVAPPGAGSVALAELMAVLPVAVLVPTAWLRASGAAA